MPKEATHDRCLVDTEGVLDCPYKVRRFNFLAFDDYETETLKLGRNPDVTTRSRGVMEKCTYCVRRIGSAEIGPERAGRPIPDGAFRPPASRVTLFAFTTPP